MKLNQLIFFSFLILATEVGVCYGSGGTYVEPAKAVEFTPAEKAAAKRKAIALAKLEACRINVLEYIEFINKTSFCNVDKKGKMFCVLANGRINIPDDDKKRFVTVEKANLKEAILEFYESRYCSVDGRKIVVDNLIEVVGNYDIGTPTLSAK